MRADCSAKIQIETFENVSNMIRQALAIHLELYHLDELMIRSVRGVETIRDYKTSFPNVIPVRNQELIDSILENRKREMEDVAFILSGKPFSQHVFRSCVIENSLALIMSEICPGNAIGWEMYEKIKKFIIDGE